MFADRLRDGIKSGAGTAGEDDTFHDLVDLLIWWICIFGLFVGFIDLVDLLDPEVPFRIYRKFGTGGGFGGFF